MASCAGLGMFLVALDIAVNVALPSIATHFRTDVQTIQWIIVSYVATRAGLAVAAGSFGDHLGLKRVFLAGVACYGVAAALISLSPSLAPVLGWRVLQGIGAAGIFAAAPAIAGQAFPAERRGMAMGIATGGFAAGTLAGTVGAGLLVGALGWKAAFLGRLPFCVLAIGLGWLVIKDPAPQERRGSFDVGGAALVVGAIVALVLGLHLGSRQGWTSPLAVASLAAVPALAATYVMSALRARRPAVDLHLLRLPPFLAACSGTFGIYLGAFVIWFIFPFFVAEVLGRGAAALGIMMGLMAAAMSLGAPLGGWLCDRIPARFVGMGGTATTALGLLWMSGLDGGSSGEEVGLRMALCGLGLGLFHASAYAMVLKTLPEDRFGTGSGSLSMAQSMGQVVSIAVWGLVFARRVDHHVASMDLADASPVAMALAFQDVFQLGAAVAMGATAAMLISMWPRRAVGGA